MFKRLNDSALLKQHAKFFESAELDNFNRLVELGQMKLTMEAVIVKGEYAQLFTDEEVNLCYELLCENGYY